MKTAKIAGDIPLIGDVKVSGSNDSAASLLFASLFFSEPVLLENVPETTYIKRCLELLEVLGVSCARLSQGRYLINSSGLASFEVPFNEGRSIRVMFYIAGPLLYRFGKAIIPKPHTLSKKQIEAYIHMWEQFGIEVFEDDRFVVLRSGELKPATIKVLEKDYVFTVSTILCSVFISGESFIFGPSQRYELADLLAFFTSQECTLTLDESANLKVRGSPLFRGTNFIVQPSTTEAVFFATASILTKGNITIKNLVREPFLAYLNILSKMGVGFEFSKSDLKVWSAGEKVYSTIDIATSPAPGFINAWHGYLLPIFSMIEGKSSILLNNFDCTFEYLIELKRLGINIQITDSTSDLDINTNQTKLEVVGKSARIGTRVTLPDVYSAGFILCTSLGASGTTELLGVEKIDFKYDYIFNKLEQLGAEIEFEDINDN